jgi:hypothetical protein
MSASIFRSDVCRGSGEVFRMVLALVLYTYRKRMSGCMMCEPLRVKPRLSSK